MARRPSAFRIDIADKVPSNVLRGNEAADEGGPRAEPLAPQPSEAQSSNARNSQQSGMAKVVEDL